MRPLYYLRSGEPCDMETWCELFENPKYKVVRQTELPNGFFVSTVWLGLDHNFYGRGPPLIFETMVFTSKAPMSESLDQERYPSELEAREGHDEMVEKWKARA